MAVDTNVLVSAIGWNGKERKIIEKAVNAELTLIIGDPIIEEFKEVLQRPKFDILDRDSIDSFLFLIYHLAEIVHRTEEVRLIEEDPDDDKVLESAIAGEADVILTGDEHILRLGTFRGMAIMRSADLLKALGDPGS